MGDSHNDTVRVVVRVAWHAGELFPRVGFVATNLKWHSKKVVHFYNRRGTAEQWIKEGKNAVKWTKLSCTTFRANAVRLSFMRWPTTWPTSFGPWPCQGRWNGGR